jgi:uncharacterized membrane protein
MLFFTVLGLATALAALASRLGAPTLETWPARMRAGMAVGLLLFGADHLATPARYLAMLPEAVPFPGFVVAFTGLCEIAGAVGLLVPRFRRLAGLMLALYFVCVFPANIRNALTGGAGVEGLSGAPAWYFHARLLFQPLAVWWALRSAEVIDWPAVARRRPGGGATAVREG